MSWVITWRGEMPHPAQVGDAWFWKPEEEGGKDCYPRDFMEPRLSLAYRNLVVKRPPIFVVLPDRDVFCVDWAWWKDGKPNEALEGWVVTLHAEPIVDQQLMLSISPSINAPPTYHGFIGSNGVPIGVIGDNLP